MTGKFLFEDIFYRDGQRKPEDPPFTPAFVVSQVISFEAAQHTNKLLANSTTEEQVHFPTSTTEHKLVKEPSGRSRPGTYPKRFCFFCGSKQQHYYDICSASGQTCTKLITLQASVNRLPKRTEPSDLPPIHLPHRVPDGNT